MVLVHLLVETGEGDLLTASSVELAFDFGVIGLVWMAKQLGLKRSHKS